jgi:hypothetical protein
MRVPLANPKTIGGSLINMNIIRIAVRRGVFSGKKGGHFKNTIQ